MAGPRAARAAAPPADRGHAIPPREAADLAARLADETDLRVATLPLDRLWPNDPTSPLNPLRATHRGTHLDEIEAALG